MHVIEKYIEIRNKIGSLEQKLYLNVLSQMLQRNNTQFMPKVQLIFRDFSMKVNLTASI